MLQNFLSCFSYSEFKVHQETHTFFHPGSNLNLMAGCDHSIRNTNWIRNTSTWKLITPAAYTDNLGIFLLVYYHNSQPCSYFILITKLYRNSQLLTMINISSGLLPGSFPFDSCMCLEALFLHVPLQGATLDVPAGGGQALPPFL